MVRPFREFHLFQILEEYSSIENTLPLDRFIKGYFRKHKAAGSKDRKVICTILYEMIRWKGVLDHFAMPPLSWDSRYAVYKQDDWKKKRTHPSIPSHVRVSFPKNYYQLLAKTYGEEKTQRLCEICNEPAPTTIRSNPLKISRDHLLKILQKEFLVSQTSTSAHGITFHEKINFLSLKEFKEGLFEVQDEGSQLLAGLMDVSSKDQVLDYCSGSGGKTLAFAHKMEKGGQIFLHDIRDSILKEARKRLKRASIQNGQILPYNSAKKKKLLGKMDWVLADVPCSGSGTLRRNPDMKWKFKLENLQKLVLDQREIFTQALRFLKPHGKIVYATCSLFPQENEKQIDWFKEKFSLKIEKKHQTLPVKGGPDGFFGVVLSREL